MRPRQPQRDVIDLERLGDVVRRARLHGVDDGLDVLVRGQHDHRQVGIGLMQALQHRDAVAVGQLVVENRGVELAALLDGLRRPYAASITSWPSARNRSATTSGPGVRRPRPRTRRSGMSSGALRWGRFDQRDEGRSPGTACRSRPGRPVERLVRMPSSPKAVIMSTGAAGAIAGPPGAVSSPVDQAADSPG